jgi:hypothetical protein
VLFLRLGVTDQELTGLIEIEDQLPISTFEQLAEMIDECQDEWISEMAASCGDDVEALMDLRVLAPPPDFIHHDFLSEQVSTAKLKSLLITLLIAMLTLQKGSFYTGLYYNDAIDIYKLY